MLSVRQPAYSIEIAFDIRSAAIENILSGFRFLITETGFSINRFGFIGLVLQIIKTMLNYKCKSYQGRSPSNITDALCIVDVFKGRILRAFAKIIPNKESAIFLIIYSQVNTNSVI